MPYKNRINTLKNSIKLVENQIKTATDPKRLEELRQVNVQYNTELKQMIRAQWDHEHETVDFEDDR